MEKKLQTYLVYFERVDGNMWEILVVWRIKYCKYTYLFKNQKLGLQRWLSCQNHLLFLQRTRVQFPALTQWLTIICDFNSRFSDSFFWLPWTPGTQKVHRHTFRQNTHVQKIINLQNILIIKNLKEYTLKNNNKNFGLYSSLLFKSSKVPIWT